MKYTSVTRQNSLYKLCRNTELTNIFLMSHLVMVLFVWPGAEQSVRVSYELLTFHLQPDLFVRNLSIVPDSKRYSVLSFSSELFKGWITLSTG